MIYLDSAATSQKPKEVIDTISDFYANHNATVHRVSYPLGQHATKMYENARKKIATFINADSVVFTKGATESINAIASSLPIPNNKTNIVLTHMEHHANIVPWQQLAKKHNLELRYIPLGNNFELDYQKAEELIDENTFVVAITHISNVLGTKNNIARMCQIAKSKGAYSIIDGAQAIAHIPIDVKQIGCDFYVFSGHKAYGPTGVGILYMKDTELLNPYQYGGNMISTVNETDSTWNEYPYKFEAGTPPIAQAIGLAKALDFISYDNTLTLYTKKQLEDLPECTVYAPVEPISLLSFTIEHVHSHDIATLLGENGICVRSGHHCAIPLHNVLEESSTIRVSLSKDNTKEEIDIFINELKNTITLLSK